MDAFGWLASVSVSNRPWVGSNLRFVCVALVCGWGHFQQWGGPTLSGAWQQQTNLWRR